MEEPKVSWGDLELEVYENIAAATSKVREGSTQPEYMLLPLPDAVAMGIDHLGAIVTHELFGGLAVEFDLRKIDVKEKLLENGYR